MANNDSRLCLVMGPKAGEIPPSFPPLLENKTGPRWRAWARRVRALDPSSFVTKSTPARPTTRWPSCSIPTLTAANAAAPVLTADKWNRSLHQISNQEVMGVVMATRQGRTGGGSSKVEDFEIHFQFISAPLWERRSIFASGLAPISFSSEPLLFDYVQKKVKLCHSYLVRL